MTSKVKNKVIRIWSLRNCANLSKIFFAKHYPCAVIWEERLTKIYDLGGQPGPNYVTSSGKVEFPALSKSGVHFKKPKLTFKLL